MVAPVLEEKTSLQTLQTMIPVIEETDVFTKRIYFSTSGAVLAFIVSSILLTNVVIKYNIIRKSQSKNASSQKSAYLMVIIYLIFTSIASFSYAFIRTNAFTRISNDQFTNIQCGIGYLLSYLFFYSSMALLYIIFIWRIHTTLKESAYRYHSCILCSLYLSIFIMTVSWWSNVIYNFIKAEWGILAHHGVSICVNFMIDTEDLAGPIFSVLALATAIFHFVMNSLLLIMFVRGLWSINKLFIKVYVKEYCNVELDEDTNSSSHFRKQPSISVVLEQCTMNDGEVSVSRSRKESTENARHILRLYDLVKKQTILVSISVISSVLLWILVLINDWFSLQIYWDVAINAICIWLMLGSSQKYWTFCTKTGMRCCYLKENIIFGQTQ